MELALSRSQYVRWRTAIFAIFLASGLSIATWASRVPANAHCRRDASIPDYALTSRRPRRIGHLCA